MSRLAEMSVAVVGRLRRLHAAAVGGVLRTAAGSSTDRQSVVACSS